MTKRTVRVHISLAIIASLCLSLAAAQAAENREENQKTDQNRERKQQGAKETNHGAGLLYSRNILGQTVRNSEGQEIGRVTELIIDRNGQVKYGVLDVGKGFLGIGDKRVAIPWNDLTLSATEQGYRVNLDKNALMKEPEYQPTTMAAREQSDYQRMSRESQTYQGKVVALDRNAGTISIRHALISHEFKLGQVAPSASVNVGDEVEVTYTDENGQKVVESVQETPRNSQ